MNDAFNSSDFEGYEAEDDPRLRRNRNTGKKFIENFLEHQIEDRTESKWLVRNQTSSYSAPGTRAAQDALVNAFDKYLTEANHE